MLEVKILEAKYEAKLEIRGGEGIIIIVHVSPSGELGRMLSLLPGCSVQHPTLTFVFGPANDLIGMWASLRISPIAVIAPSTQLMNTSSGVWQVLVLQPL